MPDDTEQIVPGRLHVLEQIYALHGDFIKTRDIACRAGCDFCCTRNVTMTSLEAGLIIRHMEKTGQQALLEKLETSADQPRFRPLTTANTLAHLCRNGQAPPEEVCDPAWRPCPLLTDNRCPIYAVRPFACRCMVSASVCREGGQAEMDDYLLALNTVFMQFVEHADAAGHTGNLIDMLTVPSSRRREACRRSGNGFVPNRPIDMLLLPPEYQTRARKIVAELSALFQ